jgi:hypothetical protein
VTRHALRSSHAATPPLRRMRQYALFAKLSFRSERVDKLPSIQVAVCRRFSTLVG